MLNSETISKLPSYVSLTTKKKKILTKSYIRLIFEDTHNVNTAFAEVDSLDQTFLVIFHVD